jgi:hypothetical protein
MDLGSEMLSVVHADISNYDSRLTNFFGQLKDWVGQVPFLVSCPKGQVEKYVNVEACIYFNYIQRPPAIFNINKK